MGAQSGGFAVGLPLPASSPPKTAAKNRRTTILVAWAASGTSENSLAMVLVMALSVSFMDGSWMGAQATLKQGAGNRSSHFGCAVDMLG
jgi:hypothetical protein